MRDLFVVFSRIFPDGSNFERKSVDLHFGCNGNLAFFAGYFRYFRRSAFRGSFCNSIVDTI